MRASVVIFAAQHLIELVENHDVVRIADRDREDPPDSIERHRQHAEAGRKTLRYHGERRRDRRRRAGHINIALPKIFRQRFAQRRFADEAEANQGLAKLFAVALLFDERDSELVFAQNAALAQNLAERAARWARPRPWVSSPIGPLRGLRRGPGSPLPSYSPATG